MSAITPLRQRMIEDLQLAGLRPRTQESYVRAVRLLAAYHGRSPDTLSEEEVRAFLLYELNEKQVAPSTLRVHLYGIRFFYERTLRRELPLLDLVQPAKRRKLPLALDHAAVKQALADILIPSRSCFLPEEMASWPECRDTIVSMPQFKTGAVMVYGKPEHLAEFEQLAAGTGVEIDGQEATAIPYAHGEQTGHRLVRIESMDGITLDHVTGIPTCG